MTDYDTPTCYATLSAQLATQLQTCRFKTISHLQKTVFLPGNLAKEWDSQGSDFFSHWLDPSLSFYCGEFHPNNPDNLFLAQKNNHRNILKTFSCFHVSHILQVDCQWGGFMTDCMCYGFDITAQTHSHDHATFCHNQVRSHKPKVNFLITQDTVASISGTFDALVDLENLNRIPIRRWSSTLNAYSKKLKKGGLLFLQVLVSSQPQSYLDIPKKNQAPLSWIQQWAKNTNHTILHTRNLTPHYQSICTHWIHNLESERKALLLQTPHVTQWGTFLAFLQAELATNQTQLVQLLIQKS